MSTSINYADRSYSGPISRSRRMVITILIILFILIILLIYGTYYTSIQGVYSTGIWQTLSSPHQRLIFRNGEIWYITYSSQGNKIVDFYGLYTVDGKEVVINWDMPNPGGERLRMNQRLRSSLSGLHDIDDDEVLFKRKLWPIYPSLSGLSSCALSEIESLSADFLDPLPSDDQPDP